MENQDNARFSSYLTRSIARHAAFLRLKYLEDQKFFGLSDLYLEVGDDRAKLWRRTPHLHSGDTLLLDSYDCTLHFTAWSEDEEVIDYDIESIRLDDGSSSDFAEGGLMVFKIGDIDLFQADEHLKRWLQWLNLSHLEIFFRNLCDRGDWECVAPDSAALIYQPVRSGVRYIDVRVAGDKAWIYFTNDECPLMISTVEEAKYLIRLMSGSDNDKRITKQLFLLFTLDLHDLKYKDLDLTFRPTLRGVAITAPNSKIRILHESHRVGDRYLPRWYAEYKQYLLDITSKVMASDDPVLYLVDVLAHKNEEINEYYIDKETARVKNTLFPPLGVKNVKNDES